MPVETPMDRRNIVTPIGRIVEVADLSSRSRDEMFALMDRYFAGMSRPTFDSDLDEKQWVLQLVDPATGAIRGFSTQMLLELDVEGRSVPALFSGDTIVDRAHWGSSVLARLSGRLAVSLMDSHADADLVWFLISMGYKTYRFLPVFLREFYPRYDAPTPHWAKATIDAAARVKYADRYDARAGVIRADPDACRLRAGVAEVTSQRLRDPHVRFFRERNPGHARGDELCCIARLTPDDLSRAAHRVLKSIALAGAVR